MFKNLAVRGKPEIVAMFREIADISGSQDTSRRQMTLDIIEYIGSLPHNEETKKLLKVASRQRIDTSGIDSGAVPPSIKIPIDIDKETWDNAMQVFRYVFGGQGNPQMPYFLRVGGNAYINWLKAQNEELGLTEEETKTVLTIDEFKNLSNGDRLLKIYELLINRR